MKPKVLKWVPVRRGHIYCSPECGFDCTIEMYNNAHVRASELCAVLNSRKPGGWEPYVHENLGWHWRAVNKKFGLSVHPFSADSTKYHAMVEPSLSSFYGPTKFFSDPHQAVRYAVRNAAAYGAEIMDAVNKFTSYLA